jgi:acyl carrier protein
MEHGFVTVPDVSPELALSEIANLVELIAGTPATKVQPDSAFVADLGVDSLSMVEILEGLQNSYGLVLTPKAVAEIKTVSQLMKPLVEAAS